MLTPPLPCVYTCSKTHRPILRCEAVCCTIINYSNQEPHRNNKTAELWGDCPSAHLCEMPHFQAACPPCQLKQEAAALCRWICSPWHAREPFELCRALGGFAKSGVGDVQMPPWADSVQWRFAKCLTPWEALTCFPFSSSLNLTGARSEFPILAGPIKSSRTVRFQALFLLILHSSLCDTVPHWAITGTVWDTLNSPSTSVWQYHSCSHLCFSSVTEAAMGSPAHFIPTF